MITGLLGAFNGDVKVRHVFSRAMPTIYPMMIAAGKKDTAMMI